MVSTTVSPTMIVNILITFGSVGAGKGRENDPLNFTTSKFLLIEKFSSIKTTANKNPHCEELWEHLKL